MFIFNPIKDWFINSMAYLDVLIYWIFAILGTVGIIYFAISKDNRGKHTAILCIVLYSAIKIVLGAWK